MNLSFREEEKKFLHPLICLCCAQTHSIFLGIARGGWVDNGTKCMQETERAERFRQGKVSILGDEDTEDKEFYGENYPLLKEREERNDGE